MNALGHIQPEQLVFADRRGWPIGDVKIPGVPPNDGVKDDNDIQLPGVDTENLEAPVSDDNVELPGVDMDGNEDPQWLRLMTSTHKKMIQLLFWKIQHKKVSGRCNVWRDLN